MKHGVITFAIATLVCAPAYAPEAQTMTLDAALGRADQHAYANRGARASADAQRGQTTATLRGLLPSLRLDAGLLRTTDPIGVFGNTLRQRTITESDFDPKRLNYPNVSRNWAAGLILEQPLINTDAIAARTAAKRMENATRHSADWVSTETRVAVIRAYYGATLAEAKVATLQAATRAAREHVRQAEQLVRNGIVTPSDALLASVKQGEVETQLIEAQGEQSTARLGLATVLGTPADTAFTLPATLPPINAIRAAGGAALAAAPALRPDVAAAHQMSEAASADQWRARALVLPRLNSFARLDWNSPARPFGGDRNWTVGVMASWSVFSGGSELAERQATRGRAAAADAMREGAEARADLERAQSRATLGAAIARLAIASRALQQSIDAHRIVGRRYDAGLASVVELLDAAAVETQSSLALVGAQFGAIVAAAERLKALGHDPGGLRALDQQNAVASTLDKP